MFCTSCGAQMPDGIKFCTRCGASLSTSMAGNTTPPPASGETSHPTARGGSYAARFINEPSPVPHRASATPPPPPPPPQSRPMYAAPRPSAYPLPPTEGNLTRRLVLAGITLVLLLMQLAGALFTQGVNFSRGMLGSDFSLLNVADLLTTVLVPFLLMCMVLQVCMRTVAPKPGEVDAGPKVVNVFSIILSVLWVGLVAVAFIGMDEELFDDIPSDWEVVIPLCVWCIALVPPFTFLFGTQMIAQVNTAPWRCGTKSSSAPLILFTVFAAIWIFTLLGLSTFLYTQMDERKEYLEERVEDLEDDLEDIRDRDSDRGYYSYYGPSESYIEEELDEAQKDLREFGVIQWNVSRFPTSIVTVTFLLGILLTWRLPKPSIIGAVVCTLGVVIYWISNICLLSLDSVNFDTFFEGNPFRILVFTDCLYMIPLIWLMYVVRREPWPQAPAA